MSRGVRVGAGDRHARARGAGARGDVRRCCRRWSDGKLDAITAETVYKAAQQGDAVANEIVRDTARYLGAGIANLLNIINADVVVVAGGVTQAGDALFTPLRAEVRRRAFRPAVDASRIVPGELPGTAGVVGAVATFKMAASRRRCERAIAGSANALGVIGSLRLGRDLRARSASLPVEEWGGIAYALSGLDAALPRRLGDRADHQGRRRSRRAGDAIHVGARARRRPTRALIEVPYPNNRVELRYYADERRSEMLTGGVPAWSWLGLKPVLERRGSTRCTSIFSAAGSSTSRRCGSSASTFADRSTATCTCSRGPCSRTGCARCGRFPTCANGASASISCR